MEIDTSEPIQTSEFRSGCAKARYKQITELIGHVEFPLEAEFSGTIPIEQVDRLRRVCFEIKALAKRDVILTGIESILNQTEKSMEINCLIAKCNAFQLRRTASLIMKIPESTHERLMNLLKCFPGISVSDVTILGLDWILGECERLNEGPFPLISGSRFSE